MVQTPTNLDVRFNQIPDDIDRKGNTLAMSALIENTPADIGFRFPESDPDLVGAWISDSWDYSGETLTATLNEVSDMIRDNVSDILTEHRTIYSDSFGVFCELSRSQWDKIFSETPPGPVDEWDPVWEVGDAVFESTYQTNAHDDHDHSASLEPFQHILDDTESQILPVRINPALAFSEVGTLSLSQAQAYVLNQWGYTTAQIAEHLEKKAGTVSSHLSRGREKVRQASWMAEFDGKIQNIKSVDYAQIFDRIGNTYDFGAECFRVVGIADDDGELVYELLSVHGSRYDSPDFFTENSSKIDQIPLSEAPDPLQDATVMDVGESLND